MKILHVLVNYHPSIGGTQIFYKGISENCVEMYDDEVEVITVDSYYGSHSNQYKKITLPTETINGVVVRRFSFFRKHRQLLLSINKITRKLFGVRSKYLSNLIIGPWSPQMKRAIDTTDADIISGSSNSYSFMQYPLYRHKLSNPKPFVYQGAIHFYENENEQSIPDVTLQSIKAYEFYLSNTTYEKDRLIKLGVPAEMIIVTGSAIDMEKYAGDNKNNYREFFGLKEDEILLGYIGRLEITKSIDVLLYAFEKAFKVNNKLRLVIAGFRYDYVNKLQAIVDGFEGSCRDSIKFLFNISAEEKTDLYNALDIYVSPSTNESFGMVFLEAWSCKKPVIGTAIGAIKSVIDEGVDGLLMQPYNVDDLKEIILKLSTNKALRLSLGESGYIKTKENYTWEIVTKKYRDTYLLAIEKFNAR